MKDHPQRSINHVILLHAEELLIGEIRDHFDRFRPHSMLHQNMILNGVVYRDDADRVNQDGLLRVDRVGNLQRGADHHRAEAIDAGQFVLPAEDRL